MRIAAIIWGPSVALALREAGHRHPDVELQVWEARTLEDPAERHRALAALREADVALVHTGHAGTLKDAEADLREVAAGTTLVCLGGDPSQWALSNLSKERVVRCDAYFRQGGVENLARLLAYVREITHGGPAAEAPLELPWEGLCHPDTDEAFSDVAGYEAWRGAEPRPKVGLLFYRAYWVNQNWEVEAALIRALEGRGLTVLPVFTESVGKVSHERVDRTHACDPARATGEVPPAAPHGEPERSPDSPSTHDSLTSLEACERFFLDDSGQSRIEVLVDFQNLLDVGRTGFLQRLGVPVIHPVVAYSRTQEDWEGDSRGLGAGLGWSVALPEFEGMIEPILVGAVERGTILTRGDRPAAERGSGASGAGLCVPPETPAPATSQARTEGLGDRYRPIPDRIEKAADRVLGWVRLRQKPVAERRVAFMLNNPACAGVELTVGSASRMDGLESVTRILASLQDEGYAVDGFPDDGKALAAEIMGRKAISEFRWTTAGEIVAKGGVLAQVDLATYRQWFGAFPTSVQERLVAAWGDPADLLQGGPPGLSLGAPSSTMSRGGLCVPPDPHAKAGQSPSFASAEEKEGVPAAMLHDGRILVTGLAFGNAVVLCQPKRGCAGPRCDGRVCKLLHDPELPPPHQYFATYRWLREGFGADVIVHVGTHGSLEFLPGKASALSSACLPDVAIGDVPFLYIYNADNPAEGSTAKRRGLATLVDHLQVVMTDGGLSGDLEELERALEDYARAEPGTRQHLSGHEVVRLIHACGLSKEVGLDPENPHATQEIAERAHLAVSRVRNTRVADGLHVFGETPGDERAVDFAEAILRTDFGDGLSLRGAFARKAGLDLDALITRPMALDFATGQTYGERLRAIDSRGRAFLRDLFLNGMDGRDFSGDPALAALASKALELFARLGDTDELRSLHHALAGNHVSSGPSGLLTRGRIDILPTGRNFYALDPRKVPTRAAYLVGVKLAERMLEKAAEEAGEAPRHLAIVWSASDLMRADGEQMSQILHLLGARPTWGAGGTITGFEELTLEELGRPRVDVTVRLSGIVRDCFAACVDLVDEVVQTVALLPEPDAWNAVRANVRERLGQDPEEASPEAFRQESFRLFGSKAGTFGSGVNLAVYASAWEKEEDLSDVFLQWNGFAYGKGTHGAEATGALAKSLETVEVTFANTASDESDLFSCCCYFSVHGGMAAATQSLSGREPRHLYGDTRDPSRVHVGTLAEEITRVTRATLLNPVWIEGQKRHGYRGAAEIAKRAVRVYGWQATTGVVEPWVFDELTRRYVLDDENRAFFQDQNPWALEELGRRMLEAEARGLWKADPEVLEDLRDRYQEVEGWLEEDMGDAGGGHQGGSVDIVRASEVPAWAAQMKRVHGPSADGDPRLRK